VKQLFNKIISIFLSFLLLATTTSFAVNLHYCCNELVDIGLFNKADSCKIILTKEESSSKHCTLEKETCCNEKTILHNGNDVVQEITLQVNINTLVYTQPLSPLYTILIRNSKKKNIPFKYYSPPSLVTDIYVIHDTFLI
jgi:hypothetical protein